MRRRLLALALVAACDAPPARVVSINVPGDTRDTSGPYVVQAGLSGRLAGDHAVLCWNVDGGELRAEDMETRDGRDDLVFAGIPGQPAGSVVGYAVVVAGRVECPAPEAIEALYSFRVLPASLACVVDSQCAAGTEICVDGTCRVFGGTCVPTASGLACPGGQACDQTHEPPLCVIPPRACDDDADCPAAETCDAGRGFCVARAACAPDLPCAEGQTCSASGLCV